MAADWIDRTIRGPAAEYLTAAELGKLFGVGEDAIAEWVGDGLLPPPVRFTKRTLRFTWRHAVYLQLRMELVREGAETGEAVKEKTRGKLADVGGS